MIKVQGLMNKRVILKVFLTTWDILLLGHLKGYNELLQITELNKLGII